jgi:hypothetical protein
MVGTTMAGAESDLGADLAILALDDDLRDVVRHQQL